MVEGGREDGDVGRAAALKGCAALNTLPYVWSIAILDMGRGSDLSLRALARGSVAVRGSLWDNRIGDDGVPALAAALNGCPHLTTLRYTD